MNNKIKSKRGFASMDPLEVKKIASRGGVSAHKKGTAHKFSSEEARLAAKKSAISRFGHLYK